MRGTNGELSFILRSRPQLFRDKRILDYDSSSANGRLELSSLLHLRESRSFTFPLREI